MMWEWGAVVAEAESRPGRRERGALEAEVLAVLGAVEGPLTPAQVLAALDDGLAYTTVMTTLARLHDKGAARRERAGRGYVYTPISGEAERTAVAMRRLLEDGADRASVLARFVEELPAEDLPTLQRLLNEAGGS